MATKLEIRSYLQGRTVEVQFAESVKEARKLAKATKHDWNRWAPEAIVTYQNQQGREVYVW